MKKLVLEAVFLAVVIGTVGVCSAKAEETKATPKKDLIVYYSFSGKTELVAKTLADALKADVVGIEDTTKPTKEQAYGPGKEASIQGKSWPIKPFNTDLSAYSRIFVGCPVWFSMPPPEFNAFVEQASITGKQVVVFVTYGGGGQAKAIKAMTDKIAGKGGNVVSSFSVKTGKATDDDIAAKAKEIAQQYMPQP